MKVKQRFSISRYVLILIITVVGINACSKDDPDYISGFYASLDGAQAIPPNTESSTGTCSATYDSIENKLAYTITWINLTGTPTAINFQVPDTGSGFTNIPVTNSLSGGGVSGYLDINEEEESALMHNNFYVNVSTASHPDGEIRGKLIKDK